MSTLRILLPGGKAIKLGSPFKKEIKKLAGFSLLLNIFSLVAISAFALLLPISGSLFNADSETSTLKFLLLFVLVFLTIFIFKLIVQGSNFIIDPKGLLMILVFNLILTTLSITITNLRVSNTFGAIGFRYLSGLALMSLIGLFYFLNLYVLKMSNLKKFLDFLTAGTVIYILLYLLLGNQTITQVLANLPLISVGFALLVQRVAQRKSRILGTFGLLVFAISVLVALPFNSVTNPTLFYYSIILFVSYFLVLALYSLKNKKELKQRFMQIKSNIQDFIKVKKVSVPTSKGIADLHLILMFLMPIFIIITSIFFFVNIPVTNRNNLFVEVANNYSSGFKMITGGTNTIDGNTIRPIIMGVGSDNYNPSQPFLVNVLVVHGLVGLTIYILLWLYFINNAKQLFLRNLKEKKGYKLSAVLLFSVILIPLNFLINYSNLLSVVILWSMFAIITALQSNSTIDYLDNTVSTAKVKLVGMVAKLLGVVLTVSAVIFTLNLIFGVLK